LETKLKTIKKIPGAVPKNKGGAPRKNIKREKDIRVRLNASERFLIDSKAKEAGMRPSNWVRAAAKSAKVVPRLSAADLGILRMLTGLANNFNQLVKLAHTYGLLTVARKCQEIIAEIDKVLKKLNGDDREGNDG